MTGLTPLQTSGFPLTSPVCSNARVLARHGSVHFDGVDNRPAPAREGDLICCKVLELGGYDSIEGIDGSRVELSVGATFIGVAGFRESGRSLSGRLPDGVLGRANLMNNGGLIGIADPPPEHLKPLTVIECLGRPTNSGAALNTLSTLCETGASPGALDWGMNRPHVVVLATGAEVGKTTLMTTLIRSARFRGQRPLAVKVAGSGRARDLAAYHTAGAEDAFDFVDLGLPSTYTDPDTYSRFLQGAWNRCRDTPFDLLLSEAGGDSLAGNVDAYLDSFSEAAWKSTRCVVIAHDVHGLVGFSTTFANEIQRGDWYYQPAYYTNASAFHKRKEHFAAAKLKPFSLEHF